MANQTGPKSGTNVGVATADPEPELKTQDVDRDELRRDIAAAPAPHTPDPGPENNPPATEERATVQQGEAADPSPEAGGLYIESDLPDFRDTRVGKGSPIFYSLNEFAEMGGSVHLTGVRDGEAPTGGGEPAKLGTFSLRLNGEEISAIEVAQSKQGLLGLGVEINRILREYGAVARVAGNWNDPEIIH